MIDADLAAAATAAHAEGRHAGTSYFADICPACAASIPAPRIVLSYGLGVDSTAILLRWIAEPETRPCPLEELLVVTAMTGDEHPLSGQLVERHVLPLLREHGIRYAQIARGGLTVARGGVTVLDDSRAPERVHLAGDYKLSDELAENGVIPTSGGTRKCSIHAKGDVLDAWLSAETAGRPYVNVIGFEANETGRAEREGKLLTKPGLNRTPSYPLIEWGWDRATCEAYIAERLGGVTWPKSACTYCPFAMGSAAGRERTLARWETEVVHAVTALRLEATALALNPTQGLIAGKRAVDLVAGTGRHGHVIEALDDELDGMEHAIYEVRRAGKNGAWGRDVRRVATGTRAAMIDRLASLGPVEVDGTSRRVWLRRRSDTPVDAEHFLTVAPATVVDKTGPAFPALWAEANGQAQLELIA